MLKTNRTHAIFLFARKDSLIYFKFVIRNE